MFFNRDEFLMLQTLTDPQLTSQQAGLVQRIQPMNLEPVIFKLVYEYGWTLEKALKVEAQYKTFLLMTLTLSEAVVPTQDIDTMWHNHILDTRLYAFHCETVFGRFLHHFPYFGVRGEDDAQLMNKSFRDTVQEFRKYAPIFGVNLINSEQPGSCVGSCSSCRSDDPPPTPNSGGGGVSGTGNSSVCIGSCARCSTDCKQEDDPPKPSEDNGCMSGPQIYSTRPNIEMLG
jgi:hypothetical protein